MGDVNLFLLCPSGFRVEHLSRVEDGERSCFRGLLKKLDATWKTHSAALRSGMSVPGAK